MEPNNQVTLSELIEEAISSFNTMSVFPTDEFLQLLEKRIVAQVMQTAPAMSSHEFDQTKANIKIVRAVKDFVNSVADANIEFMAATSELETQNVQNQEDQENQKE